MPFCPTHMGRLRGGQQRCSWAQQPHQGLPARSTPCHPEPAASRTAPTHALAGSTCHLLPAHAAQHSGHTWDCRAGRTREGARRAKWPRQAATTRRHSSSASQQDSSSSRTCMHPCLRLTSLRHMLGMLWLRALLAAAWLAAPGYATQLNAVRGCCKRWGHEAASRSATAFDLYIGSESGPSPNLPLIER